MTGMTTPAFDAPADWPWDAMPADLLDALTSSLARQLAPGPVYLLIDPMSSDVSQPIDTYPRHPVTCAALQSPAEQLPYLVELRDANDPLLAQSIAWAAEEHLRACANGSGPCRIAGWLQPHVPNGGATLARQIGALLQARNAPGGGHYLRLADRRVLALLHRLESPAIDWPRQLKGMAHWIYLDANFALRMLQGQSGPAANQPLQLNAAHWQCVIEAEAINRSLMAWQGFRHPLPDDAVAQVMAPLARARRHGLHEPQDLAAYAAEALQFSAFEQYPDLAGRIARCLHTQQPLADRLQALRGRWTDSDTASPPPPPPPGRRP